MIYLITLKYNNSEKIRYQLIFIMGCIFYLSMYIIAKIILSDENFIKFKPYLIVIAIIDSFYLLYQYNNDQYNNQYNKNNGKTIDNLELKQNDIVKTLPKSKSPIEPIQNISEINTSELIDEIIIPDPNDYKVSHDTITNESTLSLFSDK
jgi:hypothetical protein